ncbi:MAG TPA: methyltransferase domain-containing protein [Candidatus Acidoferrales bacterium]|nr:methyltransferase domain-containing protein [Candidatus Acidoferrales bacterium]
MNPREPREFPLGRWNLYIGGAGRNVPGYVNLDLVCVPGVDVAADAECLPFGDNLFERVECDAVLEHVRDPGRVMSEIRRVLAPGGYAHFVTPFCHPFHEYPRDFRRFTPEGLRQLACGFEVAAEGWRTGPAATMLVFALEFAKGLLPWQWWRGVTHVGLGWALFPWRYLDLWLLKTSRAGRIGNHCYLWVRKPN